MSHFTTVTTHLKNKVYLQKAINNLQIRYSTKTPITIGSDSMEVNKPETIIISELSNNPIGFKWGKNNKYMLMVDNQLWNSTIPVEVFLDKLVQQYAKETVISESKELGFTLNNQIQNSDGSMTITMQKWSTTTV